MNGMGLMFLILGIVLLVKLSQAYGQVQRELRIIKNKLGEDVVVYLLRKEL